MLNRGMLRTIECFEYLDLPIGDQEYVENFVEGKFRSVEMIFFAIRHIGPHNGLIIEECLNKTFCTNNSVSS